MAWIETSADDAADGRLRRIFDAAVRRAGRVFGIVRLQSLDAATLNASLQLYAATTTAPDAPLPRWFRELIAVRVSRLNHCHY